MEQCSNSLSLTAPALRKSQTIFSLGGGGGGRGIGGAIKVKVKEKTYDEPTSTCTSTDVVSLLD